MESKRQALHRLVNNYIDYYGRITLFPANQSDPLNDDHDSENQGLWTGEGAILLKLNGLLTSTRSAAFGRAFQKVTLEPGLISRHPDPFWRGPHHIVSHDEYNGLMFECITARDQDTPKEVLDYGSRHFWSYVDGFENASMLERIKLFFRGWRQPRDKFLYKIAAGQQPTLFETINASIAHILTSRKVKGNTSGKIMAWFRQKAVQMTDFTGYKRKIWDYAVNKFDKNCEMCYNSYYYPEKLMAIYFPANHPFQALIKGLR